MSADLLAIGDNVVDRYPARGVMFPGGNAVNVAVHARRCSAASGYIGVVGTDEAGVAVLSALRTEGVDTSGTRVVDGPNAYAVVEVVDGNRVFAKGDVGVSRFRLSEADLREAGRAAVVHTGECSMVESDLPALAAASRLLSFDFSERPWAYVQRYAAHADIAVISRPRGEPRSAGEDAAALQALGPDLVAVTLGEGGALVRRGTTVVHAPAPAGEVVDTLGAGDAFIGRLLTGLIAGEPLETLVAAATAYATLTCAAFGAFGYATPIERMTPIGSTDRPMTKLDSTAPLDPTQEGVHQS